MIHYHSPLVCAGSASRLAGSASRLLNPVRRQEGREEERSNHGSHSAAGLAAEEEPPVSKKSSGKSLTYRLQLSQAIHICQQYEHIISMNIELYNIYFFTSAVMIWHSDTVYTTWRSLRLV